MILLATNRIFYGKSNAHLIFVLLCLFSRALHASELMFDFNVELNYQKNKPINSFSFKPNKPIQFKLQAESDAVTADVIVATKSNSIWPNAEIDDAFFEHPYQVALFDVRNGEDSERLWSQTKIMYGFGLGVMGILVLMPEDVTKWESSDETYFEKWWNNVKAGPVWDRDQHWLNYLAHPYVGGAYYHVARKSGYRQWDSFLYSAFMSTFFWEYGIEAFAEIPSIQDLVVTPVAGWIVGEWMFETEQDIRLQGGTVLGSQTLGSFSLVLLDPVDAIGEGINKLMGHEVLRAGSGYLRVKQQDQGEGRIAEGQIQFQLRYQLALDTKGEHRRYVRGGRPIPKVVDPVGAGIIGFSAGIGHTHLDPYWQVSNNKLYTFSLGLYFSPQFSSVVSYSKADLTDLTTGRQKKRETYHLSGQYYFNAEQRFRPFVTVGFGESLWDKDNRSKYFQLHTGLGLYYKISPKWALQTDWRIYHSTRFNATDQTAGARFIYRFNKGE